MPQWWWSMRSLSSSCCKCAGKHVVTVEEYEALVRRPPPACQHLWKTGVYTGAGKFHTASGKLSRGTGLSGGGGPLYNTVYATGPTCNLTPNMSLLHPSKLRSLEGAKKILVAGFGPGSSSVWHFALSPHSFSIAHWRHYTIMRYKSLSMWHLV